MAPDMPPIELPEPVPAGALCSDAAASLEAALAQPGANWWHGAAVDPTAWPARIGTGHAVPTDPNAGHARTGSSGPETGLQCQPGVHCGFVASNVAEDAAKATLAIRWATTPGREARTLLTLNTGGAARKTEGENYLFLSEADGMLTVKDDAGRIALNAPCPPRTDPRLAIVSLVGDRVALTLDGEVTQANGTEQVLHGPASLFIAARNQRPKLLKTLGAALILDVWLWPGRAELTKAELTALNRYHLWAGG